MAWSAAAAPVWHRRLGTRQRVAAVASRICALRQTLLRVVGEAPFASVSKHIPSPIRAKNAASIHALSTRAFAARESFRLTAPRAHTHISKKPWVGNENVDAQFRNVDGCVIVSLPLKRGKSIEGRHGVIRERLYLC